MIKTYYVEECRKIGMLVFLLHFEQCIQKRTEELGMNGAHQRHSDVTANDIVYRHMSQALRGGCIAIQLQ